MELTLSHFWKYKIYKSERQKRQNGKAEGGCNGPFYFEQAVSNNEVKKWIREHLGVKDTSHILAYPSKGEKQNQVVLKAWEKAQIRLLRQEQKQNPAQGCYGAKSGNLVVKWLKPEIK